MTKKYHGIKQEIHKRADEASGSEKYAIRALGHQVDAFNTLDDRMEELQDDIQLLNRNTTRLMKVQIVLIIVQVILATFALMLALNLPEIITIFDEGV
jgi:hypothetical protein